MMLLAHLLHQNTEWRSNRIRLMRVVEKVEAVDEVRAHLIELGARSRIDCDARVIVSRSPARDVIHAESAGAAIVFMGFQTPAEGDEVALFNRMEALTQDLPRVIFVDSAGGMTLES